MKWSYTIGRIAGTDIKVHVTFLILVAFWALWRARAHKQSSTAAAQPL